MKQSILTKAAQIVKGQIAVLSNSNQDIKEDRLAVCKGCPLFKTDGVLGRAYCDPTAYVNPATLESLKSNHPFSYSEKQTYKQGCGCTLHNDNNTMSEKTRVVGSGNTCPSRQWNDVEVLYFRVNHPKNYEIEITPDIVLTDTTKQAQVNKLRNLIKVINNNGITLACYANNINLSLKSISHKALLSKYKLVDVIYDLQRANIYCIYHNKSNVLLYDMYDNFLSLSKGIEEKDIGIEYIKNNFSLFNYMSINSIKELLTNEK